MLKNNPQESQAPERPRLIAGLGLMGSKSLVQNLGEKSW